MQRVTGRVALFVACDTALIDSAVLMASYLRLGDDTWMTLTEGYGIFKVLLIVAVCQLCLYYADLYALRRTPDLFQLLVRSVQASVATSLVLAVIYFWLPSWIIGRGVAALTSVLAIAFVLGWRIMFEWLTGRVAPRERLLLIGTGRAVLELARELHDRRQELGVEIVGFVDPDPAKVGTPVLNPGVIGTIEDIPSVVADRGVGRVVVSLKDARGKLPMDKLLDIRLAKGVTFDHLASVYEEYTGKIALENLRPSWFIFSGGFRKTRGLRAAKRASDLLVASAGLVLGTPIMLAAALLVKLTSPGSALYHQRRVGLYGRVFVLHKLRTMRQDAEAGTGAVWARKNDDRVTPVGSFLRRTRLDELPQLWSVLMGDMSLVGPRPERPEFIERLTQQIPFYGQRHVVKPGLSGWAQVNYMYGASVEDAIEKLQYDLFYVKNMSIALDLFIIAKTTKTILQARGI